MLSESRIKDFFTFVNERHAIYVRRSRGDEWPWTEDPILQSYKFTNIFRELDTGTIWCRENIREPYAYHPELFFNIALYRMYNYIPTAKFLGFIENYDQHYVDDLHERHKHCKVFTSAHMLNGLSRIDKVSSVFGMSGTDLWNKRREVCPQPGDTLEQAFKRLNGHVFGFGGFLAFEAITDLRHTRYLDNASDIQTWANPGPGCKRGIGRLLGLPVWTRHGTRPTKEDIKKFPKEKEMLEIMRILLDLSDKLPRWIPPLEMRDIEHSLCEFDKYERVRLGEGRLKHKYHYGG